MSTRDRIVSEALKQFNKHGVHSVSTNHIAEAMNMSPGNLYYHFRNKNEIIRAIYHKMILHMDHVWVQPTCENIHQALSTYIKKTIKLLYKYRFFYREIGTILNNDPILKHIYSENRTQRLGQMLLFFQYLETQDLIHLPESESKQKMLIDMVWYISEWNLAYGTTLESTHLIGSIVNSFQMCLLLLEPYVTDKFDTSIFINPTGETK